MQDTTEDEHIEGEQDSHQTPATRQVAIALNVRPEHLEVFVDCHPNPTAKTVLALADQPPADQDTRDMVAQWVEHASRDLAPLEDWAGGHPARLIDGGEA